MKYETTKTGVLLEHTNMYEWSIPYVLGYKEYTAKCDNKLGLSCAKLRTSIPAQKLFFQLVQKSGVGGGTVAHHGTLLGSESTYMKEATKSAEIVYKIAVIQGVP